MENANMKTLLSTAAVVALLAAAPAFAAENPVPADQQAPAATDQTKTDDMMKKMPAAEAPAAPDTKAAETPAATDAAKPAEAAKAPDATDAAKPAEAAKAPDATDQSKPAATASADQPKFITQQTDQEKLASKWIGQTIYNQADENVGDVNDLVIGQNGQIDAVVVGVGGFLGIGEKSVAIPFSAVQSATDADGNVKLVVQLSKDDFNKAPEFLTLADIKAKEAKPAEPAPAPAPAQ
jgi:sporulation protein YlmC with PRC-barrel domain